VIDGELLARARGRKLMLGSAQLLGLLREPAFRRLKCRPSCDATASFAAACSFSRVRFFRPPYLGRLLGRCASSARCSAGVLTTQFGADCCLFSDIYI
jgi:hypothetical protein